jgi:hypothetical protein
MVACATALWAGMSVTACDDSAGPSQSTHTNLGPDAGAFDSGSELVVPGLETGRVHVTLDPPAVVDATAAWDLAFDGYDVFTNGGASGPGSAAAIGPLDAITFLGDKAPEVPFLRSDRTGGAFLDWFSYSGAPAHALYSRYHVYGVHDDAGRLFKVQVLGYYGQRDGAAVSGLYTVRYAELTTSGAGPTQEVTLLDATAGGPTGAPTVASECIDLATNTRSMKSPSEARTSKDWHLCFRRDSISVNGEEGGPRNAGAVDLDAALTQGETVAQIETRTPESERARFDAVTAASFEGTSFRGDRIVSAFDQMWIDRTTTPPTPAYAAWLVQTSDGKRKVLVGFVRFDGATSTSPGTIVLRVKPLR